MLEEIQPNNGQQTSEKKDLKKKGSTQQAQKHSSGIKPELLMTIEEEKNEGDNDRTEQIQNQKMTNGEIESAQADSDEDGEDIKGLILKDDIDDENDGETTHFRMRRSEVPA